MSFITDLRGSLTATFANIFAVITKIANATHRAKARLGQIGRSRWG